MKEIKELNKWERFCIHTQEERLNIVSFPKLICRSNAIPIKILGIYFVDIDQLILKFYGEAKDPEYNIEGEDKSEDW